MPTPIDKQVNTAVNETDFLFEIGKMFTTTPDIEQILDNVLKLLSKHLKIMKGMINIYHERTRDIFIDVSFGYTNEEVKRGIYKPGEGVIGNVISSGKPMVVPSINNEPKFLDKTGSRTKSEKRDHAFICVPIRIEKNTIGTISIDIIKKKQPTSFNNELNILSTISIMIAHAVNIRKETIQRETNLKLENDLLKIRLSNIKPPNNIIGTSKVMHDLYEKINLVSPLNTTILITGESGTGKELIADAIHLNSKRNNKPFIKINISALPESLIESELFGHERGAFTGAISQKKGRFELSDGGTIFLDEIGDLNPNIQVKLLRVIQEKSIERLGGTTTIPLDVRIIAATHQNLENKIKLNEFRSDLYYRLNVFPIYSPPLRERKADIMLLADYFLGKYNKEINKNIKRISSEAIDMLTSYHWPGNVRELSNCIERAVIVSNEDAIRSFHLPPSLQVAKKSSSLPITLEEMINLYQKEIIIDHLKITHGNISNAARILGTTKRILTYKVNKLGIDYIKYK